eukprot:10763427-Karenia_brevis.AAC.1
MSRMGLVTRATMDTMATMMTMATLWKIGLAPMTLPKIQTVRCAAGGSAQRKLPTFFKTLYSGGDGRITP